MDPAAHVEQPLPVVGAKKPAAQGAQDAGRTLPVPGGHWDAAEHTAEPTGLKVLEGHAAHAPAPAEDTFVPAAQGVHVVAPAGAFVPAAHVAQLMAPLAFTARPAGHSAQGAPRNDALEKRPGAHGTHAAPDAALPAGHAAALATHTVPLGWLSWPAPQAAQRAFAPTPTAEENVPGGHVRHAAAKVALVASL
jgi:hypothetical protein